MEVPGCVPPTLSFPLERKKGSLLSVDHLSRGEGVRMGEVKRNMGILWHSKD